MVLFFLVSLSFRFFSFSGWCVTSFLCDGFMVCDTVCVSPFRSVRLSLALRPPVSPVPSAPAAQPLPLSPCLPRCPAWARSSPLKRPAAGRRRAASGPPPAPPTPRQATAGDSVPFARGLPVACCLRCRCCRPHAASLEKVRHQTRQCVSSGTNSGGGETAQGGPESTPRKTEPTETYTYNTIQYITHVLPSTSLSTNQPSNVAVYIRTSRLPLSSLLFLPFRSLPVFVFFLPPSLSRYAS